MNKHLTILSILVLILFSCNTKEVQTEVLEPNTICSLCPKIEENQDTLAYIREVMHFVSSNVDAGLMHNEYCENIFNKSINEIDVDSFLYIFEKNEGILKCGGTALLMTKILNDNGIKAYTYNFGFKDHRLSHVVCLVAFNNDFLIFDPYLGYELKNYDKNIGLLKLFELIQSNQISGIHYYGDTINYEMLVDIALVDLTSIGTIGTDCFSEFFGNAEKIDATLYLINKQRCFACDTADACNSFIKDFEEKLYLETGYKNFYEGMTLKIYDIYGAENSNEVNNQIDSLSKIINKHLN